MARSNSGNLIQIPLSGQGMNQSMGIWNAPPGTLYEVKNGRCVGNGPIEKRPGVVEYTGATNKPNSNIIAGDGTSDRIYAPSFVVQIGDRATIGTSAGQVFCLDELSAGKVFHFQGRSSTCKPLRRRSGLIGNSPGVSCFAEYMSAVAVNSAGYILTAGITDNDRVQYAIETPDGVRIYYDEAEEFGQKVQAVAAGTSFIVIYQRLTGGGTALIAKTLTPDGTDVDLGSETTVATLNGAAQHWDTTAWTSTTWGLVHQSAATTIRVDAMSSVTSSGNTTFTVAGDCPVSAWVDSSSRIWVGYYNDPTVTGNVRYRVYSVDGAFSFSSVLGETTIASAANVHGPPLFGPLFSLTPGQASTVDTARFVYRYVESGGNELRAMYSGTATVGGTVSTPLPAWHVLPISKPDSHNRVWCLTDHGSSTQFLIQRATLLRLEDPWHPPIDLVSVPFAGTLGSNGPANDPAYFHAVAETADRSVFCFPFVFASDQTGNLARIETLEYQGAEHDAHLDTVRLGPFTAIAGQPVELPGKIASQNANGGKVVGGSEIGFLQPPVIVSATIGSGSGANIFSYRAVYEWSDALGRRHQSAPSAPISISGVGDAVDVDLVITTCEISSRVDDYMPQTHAPSIVIYRTVNGGTTYHRVRSAFGSDINNGYVTATDTASDDDIRDEAALYTDGGVQNNDIAPSCRFFTASEERLWVGGLWDPRIIQCSKIIIPQESIAFTDHEAFQVALPGECTGLAYMDGQVVAFTADDIFAISGDGPNDQGVGGFSPPSSLRAGLGCNDYRSVLETPIGVMFQSAKGIMLLPRGFGPVQAIGLAIRDLMQGRTDPGVTFTERPIISAAVLATNRGHLARFLAADEAGGSSGTTVFTYNIDTGIWTYDDYAALGALSEIGAWPDNFVLVNAELDSTEDGPIWWEARSATGEGDASATHIQQFIRTTWIHPFGPLGHGHVKKILVSVVVVGACTLTVGVRQDDRALETRTFTLTANAENSIQGFLVVPKYSECSMLQIELTEMATGGTATRGIKFVAITIEAENDGGTAQRGSWLQQK